MTHLMYRLAMVHVMCQALQQSFASGHPAAERPGELARLNVNIEGGYGS